MIQSWDDPDPVPEEVNTVRLCPTCGTPDMLIRDPRGLADGSVYCYCPRCGTTYTIRWIG